MFLPVLSLFLMVQANAATTLKDAFDAAKKNMETLKRADAAIEQRLEQRNRARGSILPTLSGVGTYTRIDPPKAAGASPFLLTRQYNAAIRVNQTLIRGGVWEAYQLADENVLLARFQKNSSEITLYQLVVNSYYALVQAQVDVKNLKQLINLSKERVGEIRERTKIGRSRRGELVEAEAQLLTFESQYQQGMINLQQAEYNFEFFTKIQPSELDPLTPVPTIVGTLGDHLSKVKTRPDIMAASQQIKVAEHQIGVARGSHYPSLDFIGNYYIDRTGILATSDWDAGLAVVIPIYQGGTVQAAIREATAGKRIAELNASETTRAAERELAILYQNYKEITMQLTSLKEAMNKSEQAYRLAKKDYDYGLVTNLDVLQSLNVFIQTKRAHDSLFAQAHMTYKNLEASVGVLP